MNIGLQLYSFGNDSPLSFSQRVNKAAELGFTGVEFASGYDSMTAEELKRLLESTGLTADSAHVPLDSMEKNIPLLAQVGVKYAICPMAAFDSSEEARELAAELNHWGKLAAEFGMKVGYHNHIEEFYSVDGKYLLDHLMEYCDPDLVKFQLDCGWASAAGVDPVEYIKTHQGRLCSIHIKENGRIIGPTKPRSRREPSPFDLLDKDESGNSILTPELKEHIEKIGSLNVAQGHGIIDWHAVKAAADANGDDIIYLIERESNYGGKDRLTCLSEDIAWVKENIF